MKTVALFLMLLFVLSGCGMSGTQSSGTAAPQIVETAYADRLRGAPNAEEILKRIEDDNIGLALIEVTGGMTVFVYYSSEKQAVIVEHSVFLGTFESSLDFTKDGAKWVELVFQLTEVSGRGTTEPSTSALGKFKVRFSLDALRSGDVGLESRSVDVEGVLFSGKNGEF